MERARTVLEKALSLSPNLARANYFYARVLRAEGNYEGASARLKSVLSQYPRDRVALNDLGRIFFLQRKYQEAVKTLESVLAIDPEDLQAHYNLMLCYNGLGNEKLSKEHEARYLRFKADESSQAITGPYRQLHPEDNNERQAVHEHVSVPLPVITARGVGTSGPITNHGGPAAPAVQSGKARLRSTVTSAGGAR
jgi:tetratricopeptide (TPR) repeat protein